MKARIAHKLTAYHWRFNRKSARSVLGTCTCGWHARFMRTPWRYKALRPLCAVIGHDADEPQPVHFGPAGFDESEDTVIGHVAICNRCLKDTAR